LSAGLVNFNTQPLSILQRLRVSHGQSPDHSIARHRDRETP